MEAAPSEKDNIMKSSGQNSQSKSAHTKKVIEADERDGRATASKACKCDHCESSYGLQKDLNKHMRLKHEEEWEAQQIEKGQVEED